MHRGDREQDVVFLAGSQSQISLAGGIQVVALTKSLVIKTLSMACTSAPNG